MEFKLSPQATKEHFSAKYFSGEALKEENTILGNLFTKKDYKEKNWSYLWKMLSPEIENSDDDKIDNW